MKIMIVGFCAMEHKIYVWDEENDANIHASQSF